MYCLCVNRDQLSWMVAILCFLAFFTGLNSSILRFLAFSFDMFFLSFFCAASCGLATSWSININIAWLPHVTIHPEYTSCITILNTQCLPLQIVPPVVATQSNFLWNVPEELSSIIKASLASILLFNIYEIKWVSKNIIRINNSVSHLCCPLAFAGLPLLDKRLQQCGIMLRENLHTNNTLHDLNNLLGQLLKVLICKNKSEIMTVRSWI